MMLSARTAVAADLPLLRPLVDAAITRLQRGFLTETQIAASRAVMGVDTQLVEDSTYFVVEDLGSGGAEEGPAVLAGCGGWSRRATLYGGDHSGGRDSALLNPRTDAARVRAMYTHPDFARRGVGALILRRCEAAAAAEGFARLELMATMSGQPLYAAAGFEAVERVLDASGGVGVPLVRMVKPIAPA